MKSITENSVIKGNASKIEEEVNRHEAHGNAYPNSLSAKGDVSCATKEDLIFSGRRVDDELALLLLEERPLQEILRIMSSRHESLTRSVIRLAENEMEKEGRGPVPSPYCWINMGSAARHEQTLRSDQDNAMIFIDPDDGDEGSLSCADGDEVMTIASTPSNPKSPSNDDRKEMKRTKNFVGSYFKDLSEKIVHGLNRCGFALCPGEVMATNPQWRKSLSQWMDTVTSWSGSFNPQDIRNLTIFLDFRPIWGDLQLGNRLWHHVVTQCRQSDAFTHLLTDDELKNSNPITFLGRIRTQRSGPYKDQINIKSGGLVHIVNAMRIYALKHDIHEASTLGRIERLTEKKVISKQDSEMIVSAFETLTLLRIQTNIKKMREDKIPDDAVVPGSLTRSDRDALKNALKSVPKIQKMLANDFSLPWLSYFS